MAHDGGTGAHNLLWPEIVAKVGVALEGGMVCGVHAFYGAGQGPEPCAFADLPSYRAAIEKSLPGDWFTLWSVARLAELGVLLICKKRAPVTGEELERAKGWLAADPRREFLAAGHAAEGAQAEAAWGDRDHFDRLEDLALRYAVSGTFAVLPLTDLLEDSPSGRWIPKFHLVDGKRPDGRGEVPPGGAY